MAVATVVRTQAPLDRLFEGSERWGWEYRDPAKFYRPFPTPEPALVISPELLAKGGGKRRAVLLGVGIGFLVYAVLFTVLGSRLGGLAFLLGIVAGIIAWRQLRNGLGDPMKKLEKEHQEAVRKWRDAMLVHDRAEWDFLNTLPVYGPVSMPPVRRVDVFGGTPFGWISLLTTFGTSCLANGSGLTVVDLSEWGAGEELLQLATDNGVPSSVTRLPQELAAFDILSGLGPGEFVDILVETIHGDEKDATKRNRALDQRVLGQVCDVLGDHLTIERVLAGLRTMLGQEPDPSRSQGGVLTPEEWDKLRAIYKDELRQENRERTVALEAQLYPLRTLGSHANGKLSGAVPLRYIAVSAGGATLINDLIVDLLPQLLIRVFKNAPGQVQNATMVVAGADRLQRRHLEKLSELANQRNVRLVYMFKSLRETAADALGGGGSAALFMKLGNPQEAERAAQFIGKGYKFELSQLSESVSNAISHAIGISEGQAVSQNHPMPGGSTSRNWGITRNLSEQFTKQDGKTVQRVYEYAVEPTSLQQLPESDVLFVHLDAKRGGRVVKIGDCNPDILTLPRVSPTPLVAPMRTRSVLSS